MACNRNDGDYRSSFLALAFIGAVVPKYAVGSGGVVLSVCLEDLLAMNAGQREELVPLQARMVRVYLQVAESLANLPEERGMCRRIFQRRQLLVCRGRKLDLSSLLQNSASHVI